MQATSAWLASTAQTRSFFAFSAAAPLTLLSLQLCFSLLSLRLPAAQDAQQDDYLLAVASSPLWRLRTARAALFWPLRWRLASRRTLCLLRRSSLQVAGRSSFYPEDQRKHLHFCGAGIGLRSVIKFPPFFQTLSLRIGFHI